jgi:hypothetical protein
LTLCFKYRKGYEALKGRLEEIIPVKKEEVKELKSKFGHVSLGEITIEQVIFYFCFSPYDFIYYFKYTGIWWYAGS